MTAVGSLPSIGEERFERVAVFGGVYSNHVALSALLDDARRRGAQALYCLGDLGAFGPNPDAVFPLLDRGGVRVLAGNYDRSIASDLTDCQCGYTDPRDNHYARLSYRYTYEKTSASNRRRLRGLPGEIRFRLGRYRVLCCHGSPRRTSEFLWESTTPTHFLDKLLRDHGADVVCATHTGIKWRRELSGDRHFVNVGVIGRPENDGRTNVWYALLEASPNLSASFVPLVYDHEALAREMESERLPSEFVETIRTGHWTTCLEVLPAKERKRGRY